MPDARPMPVYDIPPAEQDYWDALDDRVTCDACRRRSASQCTATRATIHPPHMKHRCEHHRKGRG